MRHSAASLRESNPDGKKPLLSGEGRSSLIKESGSLIKEDGEDDKIFESAKKDEEEE